MIYLDSCAVVKLIRTEPESTALMNRVFAAAERIVTSELTIVETHRALIRCGCAEDSHNEADGFFEDITIVALAPVIRAAARHPGQNLRSLDALHLATAMHLQPSAMITYDKRLASVAESAGLNVEDPR
ncbi:MAG: type II toxin-antitoxin system VapC family toxin [Stackebrandtia sp.]